MDEKNSNQMNFGKICDDWLKFKKPRLKVGSYSTYKFRIDKHLKKSFGDKDLQYFMDHDVNDYTEILQQNLSNRYTNDIITVLKSILKFAEIKYKRDFNLELIASPSANSKEVMIFDDKERKRLENYLLKSDDPKALGVLISLYAGLRIGEACALKWKDIDLEKGLISVNHTILRIYLGKDNSQVVMTTPKTKKSLRKIPIGKILLNRLKSISKNYSKEAFVITGKEGKFMEPIAYMYNYKKILEECNVKYRKYHCLRHTFATRCINLDMDVKSLSEILGHSNAAVTLNIYVHSSYKTKKKFMDKL